MTKGPQGLLHPVFLSQNEETPRHWVLGVVKARNTQRRGL